MTVAPTWTGPGANNTLSLPGDGGTAITGFDIAAEALDLPPALAALLAEAPEVFAVRVREPYDDEAALTAVNMAEGGRCEWSEQGLPS